MIPVESDSRFNRVIASFRRNIVLFSILGVALCLIAGLAAGIVVSQDEREYARIANILMENNLLIDGHNDIASMIRKNFQNQFEKFDINDMLTNRPDMPGTNNVTHTDIKRLRAGRVGAQFWAAYASCESLAKDAPRIHIEQLDVIKRMIRKFPDDLEEVTTTKDIMRVFKNNKIASLIGLESGHAIDSSLSILRIFYRLGVRYMTLTHNCNVPWATNNQIDNLANASMYGGLTDFGEKVIAEMNRLGMIVDLSHTSHQTQLDVLVNTKAPVMFSHSSVYKLCNHTRNVRDDVLEELKKNNGIIMINFYTGFLNCQDETGKNTDVDKVIEHITYVKNLIGIDHVGLGSDYDGVPTVPSYLEDVSKFPNLIEKLLKIGWSDNNIIKLMGGNLIRVFSDVEKYAQSVSDMAPINDLVVRDSESRKCFTNF